MYLIFWTWALSHIAQPGTDWLNNHDDYASDDCTTLMEEEEDEVERWLTDLFLSKGIRHYLYATHLQRINLNRFNTLTASRNFNCNLLRIVLEFMIKLCESKWKTQLGHFVAAQIARFILELCLLKIISEQINYG